MRPSESNKTSIPAERLWWLIPTYTSRLWQGSLTAVGSEIAIVHPDHADTAAIATIIGGAALFLFGCLLFKWFSYDRKTPPLSHGVGLLLLALLCFSSLKHWFTTAQLGALTAAVMFIVAAWETVALSRPKSAFRSDE
jgi:low temperature requirement protein LtrA